MREVREGNPTTMVERSVHIGGWSDKEVKMIAFSNSIVNHSVVFKRWGVLATEAGWGDSRETGDTGGGKYTLAKGLVLEHCISET